MHVYEAMADAFVRQGTTIVFALMGDGNKLWLHHISRRPEVDTIHVRHEGAALAMADGHARTSGFVGICSVTYATGVTQLATSLGVAAKARTPIVIMAADTPTLEGGMGGHRDIDTRALVRATGALVHEVRQAHTAVDDVHIAFHRARAEMLPVVLLCRADILEAALPTVADAHPDPGRQWRQGEGVRPDPHALARAADLISLSDRCVVLLGRGAKHSSAEEAARALADACGAVVATTLPAKGLLDGYPYSVGIAGTYSLPMARQLLSQSDCVIALGASLNSHTLAHGGLFGDSTFIQVDTTGHALMAEGRVADCYLHGDASATAAALAEVVKPSRRWQDDGLLARLSTDQRRLEMEAQPARVPTGTLDPRELMLRLDGYLPKTGVFIVGAGHFTSFPVMYLSNPQRRDFHTILDFATIGQALPTAIGASHSGSDEPVIAFEGDASIMMHIQEMETAARYGVPLLLFVMNDGLLGAEYHKLRELGLSPSDVELPTADLVDLACTFGWRARRLTALDDVATVVKWFDPDLGPHLVDCSIARTVVGPMSHRVDGGKGRLPRSGFN